MYFKIKSIKKTQLSIGTFELNLLNIHEWCDDDSGRRKFSETNDQMVMVFAFIRLSLGRPTNTVIKQKQLAVIKVTIVSISSLDFLLSNKHANARQACIRIA